MPNPFIPIEEENSPLECFECNSSDYERVTKDYDSVWGPTGIAIHVPDVVHLICPVCGDCILDEVALAKIDEVIERVREPKGNDNE
jgi:YgiT-type zinc finger domain-containing protein